MGGWVGGRVVTGEAATSMLPAAAAHRHRRHAPLQTLAQHHPQRLPHDITTNVPPPPLSAVCAAADAAGEYIAVEKVEGIYKMNSAVEQIWVYGNSYESCVVAVVVPVAAKLQVGGCGCEDVWVGLCRWLWDRVGRWGG